MSRLVARTVGRKDDKLEVAAVGVLTAGQGPCTLWSALHVGKTPKSRSNPG